MITAFRNMAVTVSRHVPPALYKDSSGCGSFINKSLLLLLIYIYRHETVMSSFFLSRPNEC